MLTKMCISDRGVDGFLAYVAGARTAFRARHFVATVFFDEWRVATPLGAGANLGLRHLLFNLCSSVHLLIIFASAACVGLLVALPAAFEVALRASEVGSLIKFINSSHFAAFGAAVELNSRTH